GRTASAATTELVPVPSGDHAVPSHRAMWFADEPPAVVNRPAATRSPFASTAKARTSLFRPEPSADQVSVAGSQNAMRCAGAVPAHANEPPTTTPSGAGPGPSGSQR